MVRLVLNIPDTQVLLTQVLNHTVNYVSVFDSIFASLCPNMSLKKVLVKLVISCVSCQNINIVQDTLIVCFI